MKKKYEIILPKVSIIIPTYNSVRTIGRVLQSIEMQDYPKEKLEVIIVDGNSTDETIPLLQKSKLKIQIIQSKYPRDPEASKGVGLTYAKGEIVALIDSDNILPHSAWIEKMIIPFTENTDIVGSAPLRFDYNKKDNYLNRYFALIGSADPVGLYLGKADKLSYATNSWILAGKLIKKMKSYFIVNYDPENFPTIGSNGFFIRRELLKKGRSDPEHFFHIDTPLDLARLGFSKYAIVQDSIIHDTAKTPSIIKYVIKRANYMRLHYQERASDRRYRVFDPNRTKDLINISLFIFFSLTLIQPTIMALNGYLKKKDLAWFVHPLFCFAVVISYAFAVFSRILK